MRVISSGHIPSWIPWSCFRYTVSLEQLLMPDYQTIQAEINQFSQDRDWDQFHSPKNLCMALSVEVAELQEHFQWLTQEQSDFICPG